MLFISSQKHGNVDKNGWVFTLINAPIVTVNDFQYVPQIMVDSRWKND